MTTQTATQSNQTIYGKVQSGEKFQDSEVSFELHQAAEAYLAGYAGSFGFLVDLKGRRSLSIAQARGVLNCMVAELRRTQVQHAPVIASPAAAVTAEVRDGYYTVVATDGSHRTLRFRHGKQAHNKSVQYVSYLYGPCNTSQYACCAVVRDNNVLWVRDSGAGTQVRAAVQFILGASGEERASAGQAYAVESGNCYVCGRLLTDPESIRLGIGPVCREG